MATPPVAVRVYRIDIPGWIPTSLNQLVGNHHKAGRLKKRDAFAIASAAQVCRVPRVGLTAAEKRDRKMLGVKGRIAGDPVAVKRHVRLEIKLAKGQRKNDADNLWKSLLDGLKQAGLLYDDSPNWCTHDSEPTYTRGVDEYDRGTVIVITEEA